MKDLSLIYFQHEITNTDSLELIYLTNIIL